MQGLPSHGWAAGWIGRRDRALLVLAGSAGLSYVDIAALTAGDLTIVRGVATIRSSGRATTVRHVDNGLLCGPCALARWVHALDLTVVYPDGRVIAAVIARAVPLTSDSPHLCHGNNTITEITQRVALLPPIDQWGHPVRMVIQQAAPRESQVGRTRRGPTVHQHPTRQPTQTQDELNHRAQALQDRLEHLLDGAIQ